MQVSSGTAAARSLQSESQSTIPIGILAFTATGAAIISQKLVARFGRRPVFLIASALGVTGASIFAVAVHTQSYAYMLLASVPLGYSYGTSNLYRFAAVDVTLPVFRERALAAVVGGAVLAAFIGPEASRHVRFELGEPYLAAFLLAAGLIVVQARPLLLPCAAAMPLSLSACHLCLCHS